MAKSKLYNIRPNRKAFIVFYLHSFFRNVHPSPIFTFKVNNVEILKPIEFQLRMFQWQSSALNLQCQAISFSISRPKYLPIHMRCYVQKPVHINTTNAMQCVLDRQLLDFTDVYFCMKVVKIVLFNEIHFVLFLFLVFFSWRLRSFLFGRTFLLFLLLFCFWSWRLSVFWDGLFALVFWVFHF